MTSPAAARAHRRSRLALLMQEVGQTRLSEKSGIAAAYLYQMSSAKGRNARPVNDDVAKSIEERVDLPEGWFDADCPIPASALIDAEARNKQTKAATPDIAQPPVSPPETDPGYVRVEQIDAVGGMGDGVVNSDNPEVIRSVEYGAAFIRSLVGFMPPPGRLKLVTGTGDSMRGMIEPGEVLLMDTGVSSFEGDGIYWIGLGDEHDGLQVKMLQRRGDGIYVVSANPFYPEFIFPPDGRIGGKLYIKHKLERFN